MTQQDKMTVPVHWTPELLREHSVDIGDGTRQVEVILAEGDSAWHPASTKKVLRGYGRVDYLFHPDGGVDAQSDPTIHQSYVEAAA